MSENKINEKELIKKYMDILIERAHQAEAEYLDLDQEKIDEIVKAMSIAAMESHMKLAKMAVEETKRGVYEDKITKNMFASEYIYHSIKYNKTVGVINDNEQEGFEEVAEPVGIIAGVTPVTNPTSTAMYKALIAVKTKNPIIFGFHPSAQLCSSETVRIIRDAAVKAGAPKYCIQWIEKPSLEATNQLMNHVDVKLILATGGSGMVKAAYSCGKPALGVGPGNVPCYIEKSAGLKRAVTDLIMSKTFDNGMICASEQSVIVDKDISKQFETLMKDAGCYFLKEEENAMLEKLVIEKKAGACSINSNIVGQSAYTIAKMAGIHVAENTKILIAKLTGVGVDFPLSKEKLSPILAYYIVKDKEEGMNVAEKLLTYGGLGHSAVIHSENKEVIFQYAERMKAGRLIVNSPSTHGAIGDIYNTNLPSLTLGCGTFGGNSTTANVSAVNLINVKRVAKRKVNMQWFKVPSKIFFERGSIQYLEVMKNVSKVVIVTDPAMYKLGYVDKIVYYLRKRKEYVDIEIFSDVESDPSFDTVYKGVQMMNSFKPDTIIALGGGSPIDAAKGMWLLYEQPEVDLNALKSKFMDIRKRIYKIDDLGEKAKFVAIPTTSGTGSEATSFAVITDKKENMKYPIADYALLPNIAIVDPDLVMTVPKPIVADTGIDVLTHAIEAYVSNMASDFTDGLAIKAVELVFAYLERSYNNPEDKEAKEKMHNASTIAGMAFTNAMLGINHSIAHKMGGQFHTPHGRANGILLRYVIKYNSETPSKFVSFPKYEYFIADEKYADIARRLGLPAKNTKEGVDSLIKKIIELQKALDLPTSFKETGIEEKDFLNHLDELAERAYEDQCTPANPRMPLVSELKEIMKDAYYGEEKRD
ncbi:MAG: bifunctional acetaldehyde-CoA/alcohol dehydrogenase [Clostridia bacterium]